MTRPKDELFAALIEIAVYYHDPDNLAHVRVTSCPDCNTIREAQKLIKEITKS